MFLQFIKIIQAENLGQGKLIIQILRIRVSTSLARRKIFKVYRRNLFNTSWTI